MARMLSAKECIRILMKENGGLVRGIKRISTELNRNHTHPKQIGLDKIDDIAKKLIKHYKK